MPRIFISYIQQDRSDFVQWIADYLETLPQGNMIVWYDRNLTPATTSDLTQQIETQIVEADYVLVVITKGIQNSEGYIHKEIAFSQLRHKIIIPILLEVCDIPLSLAGLFYVDFTGDRDVAISELVLFLKGERLPPRRPEQMSAGIRAVYHQYLRSLAQRLGVLPLSTVDLLSEELLRISDIWVPLNTTTMASSSSVLPGNARFTMPLKPVSVLDMVSRERHLILTGDPGAGKSTVARYVALALSGAELDDARFLTIGLSELGDNWNRGKLCPIYLELREFAARGLPDTNSDANSDSLLEYLLSDINSSVALHNFAPELESLLGAGQCFVLLDGLDEIPLAHNRRNRVIKAVKDFTAMFAHCNILVTTRTYAYRRGDWQLSGFAEAEIAPFTEQQINLYIDRWYAALSLTRPHLAGRAVALQREIKARPDDLGYLARRPLLLALMASLHSRTNDSLPETRATLYRQVTQLLLDHWERAKIITDPANGMAQLTPSSLASFLGKRTSIEDLRNALNTVAFEAQRDMDARGEADITSEHLAFTLRKSIYHDPSAEPGPSEFDIVEELKDRSGILLAYDEDIYRFPHRTFQEYMAACHLLTDDLFPDELVQLVQSDPERWREVLIFAVGEVLHPKQRSRYVWELLNALVPDLPPEDDSENQTNANWSSALCAGLALSTNQVPEPTKSQQRGQHYLTYNRIRTWMREIVKSGKLAKQDRLSAGLALSLLGDDRFGVGIVGKMKPEILWSDYCPDSAVKLGNENDTHSPIPVRGFRMAVYLVTNVQFQAFVDDPNGWSQTNWWNYSQEAVAWRLRRTQPSSANWRELNCPRTNVTWYEAMAFCQWLSSKDGFSGVRLPTEAEWEYCARGRDRRLYPWGNVFDEQGGNVRVSDSNLERTTPVGMYPEGCCPFGVLDLIGNVWEWTQTEFRPMPYNSQDGRELTTGNQNRVVRGGSWRTRAELATTLERGSYSPSEQTSECGFRLCLPSNRD